MVDDSKDRPFLIATECASAIARLSVVLNRLPIIRLDAGVVAPVARNHMFCVRGTDAAAVVQLPVSQRCFIAAMLKSCGCWAPRTFTTNAVKRRIIDTRG